MTAGAFTYEALPMRVVFGPGRLADLHAEVSELGLHRLLVLTTPNQRALADRVAGLLGDRAAGVFAGARMHVPAEVAAAGQSHAREVDADGCVAIGGGSTIGLGKAIALETGLPVVAVPTTYSGSEMTPVWGITEAGRKRTGRDPAVLPRSVLYDPDLTTSLPAVLSGTSGINALAHAVESLYAPDTSPVIGLFAEEGIRCLAAALPAITADPSDRDARSEALRGAWLCGACLGATTMSLHHKLCHVLGGTFDLPHAPTHAVVLPHVAAFNLPAAPAAHAALSRALETAHPARALADLATAVGAPRSLAELGLREADLPEVIEQVLAQPYANPRTPAHDDLDALLTAAHSGVPVRG
ncbi:maleylacetate reductase [Amycolatopsis bartoniae]|uniref:Maleylacetate reductase n=2 Tax=Amycolatopsis bartoniae TaxID=941986 RepID=A0A8H9ITE7_9PSEU|nr:maleylacetate reductase [Amycolatopsis bartoniae]MBB2939880.1 maleylacetate reductase [Amycolatopsis bartoniae]GHF35917.1 maleylacetate reductase [Amycolatopsis bartoniae]